MNWLLGGGAVIFLLALLFLNNLYKNYKRIHVHKMKEPEKQKQLQIAQALMDGEERERQRIGRDLHDGLGGALSGIKIKLSQQQKATSLPVVEKAVLQLDNSITELQHIARNMMPETFFRSGLETALKDLCVLMSSNETRIEVQANGVRKKHTCTATGWHLSHYPGTYIQCHPPPQGH